MLDASSQATKLAFVLQQLSRYSGKKKKINTESTFVACPFHNETEPSGRIFHGNTSRSPGYFRCYGCGAKASWNELAPMLGLEPYGKQKPKDQYALDLKFDPDTMVEGDGGSGKGEIHITGHLPSGKRWRGIPTNYLISIGGSLCKMYYPDSDFWTEQFVYLPALVRGKERGFIRARLRKAKDKPSYLNAPGAWSLRYGFFPFDAAVGLMKEVSHRTVVLVEGPRDALRLLIYGIPAMAILGTQSWSAAKSRILELGGVDTVYLFMDGDGAGKKATTLLRRELTGHFNVKVIKLWALTGSPYLEFLDQPDPTKAAKAAGANLWDPGNCPQWILHQLKRRISCR